MGLQLSKLQRLSNAVQSVNDKIAAEKAAAIAQAESLAAAAETAAKAEAHARADQLAIAQAQVEAAAQAQASAIAAQQTQVNGLSTSIVASIVDAAPATLDTLNELAAALGDDPNFATTITTSIGTKLSKSSNLSDLTNTTTARSNLGLGTLATLSPSGTGNSSSYLRGDGTWSSLSLSASAITSGTISAARLGSGTPNGLTYLRGDGTWATISGGSSTAATNSSLGSLYGYTSTNITTIGYNANASGSYSISSGYGAQAYGSYSIALGYYTTTYDNSIAIGNNARSSYNHAIMIGYDSQGNGENSVAIGTYSQSYSGTVSVGYSARSGNSYQTVVGANVDSSSSSVPNLLLGSNINSTASSGQVVVLNAGSSTYNISSPGFYTKAITSATTANVLYYDAASGKVTYGAAPSGGSTDTTVTITTTAKIIPMPQTSYQNGGNQMVIGFQNNTIAQYVSSVIITGAMSASNAYSSLMVEFVIGGNSYVVSGIDSMAGNGWITINGGQLTINNYSVSNNGGSPYPDGVYVTFYQNIQSVGSATPTSITFQTNGTIQELSESFNTHKPFGIIVSLGNYQGAWGTFGPMDSTPQITNVQLNGNSNTITGTGFTSVSGYNGYQPRVVFILGQTTTTTSSGGSGGSSTAKPFIRSMVQYTSSDATFVTPVAGTLLFDAATNNSEYVQNVGGIGAGPFSPLSNVNLYSQAGTYHPWLSSSSVPANTTIHCQTNGINGGSGTMYITGFILDSTSNPSTQQLVNTGFGGSINTGEVYLSNPPANQGYYFNSPGFAYVVLFVTGPSASPSTLSSFTAVSGVEYQYFPDTGNVLLKVPGAIWGPQQQGYGKIGTVPGYSGNFGISGYYFGN